MPQSTENAEQLLDETAPRTLAEKIYRQLRADIVWGRLSPGARLRVDELRQTYSIGISPLREALFRLSSEELVIASGQRGFRVAPLDVEDVRDTMETRLVIECEALVRSIDFGDVSWEASVVAAYHKLTSLQAPSTTEASAEQWTKYHRDFHMALISSCRSRWLMTFAGLLFDQAERHRIVAIRYRDQLPDTRNAASEHKELLDATLARKKAEATEILTRHYRATADNVIGLIETHLGANAQTP